LHDPNKKLLELSEEELLLALQNTDSETESDVPFYSHPIEEFLTKFEIESGNIKITPDFLLSAYLTQNTKLSKAKFIKEAAKFIRYDRFMFYISDKSFETLKKLAPNDPAKKRILKNNWFMNSFVAFMQDNGLAKGEHRIPDYVFFHYYRCFCIDKKRKQMNFQAFNLLCSMQLDSLASNNGKIYLINQSNLIDKKEYGEIKKIYEKTKK
jgi:hypothetical protein